MNGHSVEPEPGPPREARGWLPRLSASAPSADPVSAHQVAADIALAAAAAVASLAVAVLAVRTPAGSPSAVPIAAGPVWQSILPGVVARTLPLTIRRLRPLTALWLCVAACLLTALPEALRWSAGTDVVNLIALVPAAYSAVAHSRYRGAALLSLPAVVVVLVVRAMAPAQSGNYTMLVILLAFIMTVLVVGNAARLSRRRASESQARLIGLTEEQENATRQAIGQERARIARELHDVVTHSVSVMVVQAGAARRVLGASPDEARSALLAIEESGREAITELQHMLGLLAQPGDPQLGDPQQASPAIAQDTAPLRPQPGLDQVGPLVDRVTAAGLPVELRVSGTPRALPPGMDLAAYRVIQEALTNVIKHAGQSSSTVTLDYTDDALMVEVADHGGALSALTAMPGGGHGLLGLRERVLLYGGELDAGSQPEGGWRVRARFPGQPCAAAVPVPS